MVLGLWQRSPCNILAIPLRLLLDRAYSFYTQSLVGGGGTCVRIWSGVQRQKKECSECMVGVDREQGVGKGKGRDKASKFRTTLNVTLIEFGRTEVAEASVAAQRAPRVEPILIRLDRLTSFFFFFF